MTTDTRLNLMINALDGRLRSIGIEQVELSVRTLKALKDCGVRTLHDAQMAIINRQLHKQHGIGPKAVREVEEIIFNVTRALPHPNELEREERRLALNSLLCGFEMDVIHLYDLQRADADPEDFMDTDRDASIAKTKSRLARIRAQILAHADWN